MSDKRYRDRNPFSDDNNSEQWSQRAPGQRQQGDDWSAGGRMSNYENIPYDTTYRSQRPTDDFSNRNARRDYDPYAANDRFEKRAGYGRAYSDPYDRNENRERGFMDRATDEVASWFGDDDAQARRDADHRGKGPRGYTRSDARILDDVSDRLADDRWVDASDVEVKVTDAEVTLTGTVRSREQKRRAEDCAEMVSGVKHVQNNLRVSDRDATIL